MFLHINISSVTKPFILNEGAVPASLSCVIKPSLNVKVPIDEPEALVKVPVILVLPSTCKFSVGLSVEIPTLPVL